MHSRYFVWIFLALALPAFVAAEVEAQVSSPAIQRTANVHDVAPARLLENTQNPRTARTDIDVVAVVFEEDTGTDATAFHTIDAAATRDEFGRVVIPGPASLEVVEFDIIGDDRIKPDIVDELPVIVPLAVLAIAEVSAELAAQGDAFALTGRQIPTKQQLRTSDGRVIDEIINDDMPGLGEETDGTMTLSGVCGDAYYVVLLYKEADEYERDPNSYILKRVYECNGAYSYSLGELPDSLPNENYYLLVGDQGTHHERGIWLPITPLIGISINRT